MALPPRIGFHASHEQFPPSELLALARAAEQAGFDCAMSSDHFRPWDCFDDAMVETFFKTLKFELVWRAAFEMRADATAAIGRTIDGFYNPIRRHSALDFTSPAQFEKMAVT